MSLSMLAHLESQTDDDLDDETSYGVDALPNGDVRLRLGWVMPFEVPGAAAIRLAALLCKKAGCEVMFRDGSMKIKFPSGFRFMDRGMETKAN